MKVLTRTNTAVSMAASFNAAAIHLEHLEGFSIIASWTETVAILGGTLKLQASNNAFDGNVNNNENSSATWVDIAGSSVTVSGSGTQAWNVSDVYYNAARLVWTRTAGDGTITTNTYAKGIT